MVDALYSKIVLFFPPFFSRFDRERVSSGWAEQNNLPFGVFASLCARVQFFFLHFDGDAKKHFPHGIQNEQK